MRVAVVHYHMRPGGVSRVIAGARAALTETSVRVAVISSGPDADVVLPELDYAPAPSALAPDLLAERLIDAATRALGAPPDCWHIHNHSLGRHPSATAAFAALARRGCRLLLQPHDFAEDGRPSNYAALRNALGVALARDLYPAASHIHYAVLNPRDRAALIEAGSPVEQTHDLPNPVIPFDSGRAPAEADGAPLLLYPTRALRRKNIGEFLLWSLAAQESPRMAITLAPTSADDLRAYTAWKALAARLSLPVEFEAGLRPGASFAALMARARAVVTTSVADGFGLAFIEPWLAQRPLVGRALPEITAEMESGGLSLRHLYRRLDVPIAWVGADRLRARIARALAASATAYGAPLPADAVESAWSAFVHDDRVDFGRLDEDMQSDVLTRLHRAPDAARGLVPNALPLDAARAQLESNAAVLRARYSLASYGARLQALYARVAASPLGAVQALDAAALLRFFLDPSRLFLLRT